MKYWIIEKSDSSIDNPRFWVGGFNKKYEWSLPGDDERAVRFFTMNEGLMVSEYVSMYSPNRKRHDNHRVVEIEK